MRIALAGFVLLAALGCGDAQAQYCFTGDDGTQQCGIPTFEACRQTASGIGGLCTQQATGGNQPGPNLIQRIERRIDSQGAAQLPYQGPGSVPPPPNE